MNKNIILNSSNIIQYSNVKISDIAHNIEENSVQLQRALYKINNFSPLEIKRNWWGGLNKESIEQGFNFVYKDMSNGLRICGDAICKSNDNMGNILTLINLLTSVEKDIYSKIDDMSISDNEFRDMCIDYIRNEGIKHKDIKEILDKSFQRAYILRDRIKGLRNNLHEQINIIKEEIDKIEEKYQKIDIQITTLLPDIKLKLKEEIESQKRDFTILAENKCKEITKVSQEKTIAMETLNKNMNQSINDANNYISKNIKESNNILTQIIETDKNFQQAWEYYQKEMQKSITKHEQELQKISDDSEKNIKTLKTNTEEYFTQNTKEINNTLQNGKKTIEKLVIQFHENMEKQLLLQKEEFDKEKEVFKNTYNNRLFYGIVISSTLAFVVSLIVNFLI
ncbi:coiled-coil domain-containing protein [Prevotella koreensis]